jgi:hypothetical protein
VVADVIGEAENGAVAALSSSRWQASSPRPQGDG